jgi:hypothetical protein
VAAYVTRAQAESVLFRNPGAAGHFRISKLNFNNGIADTGWPVGMAIKTAHKDLGQALEAAMKALRDSGEMLAMFKQHGRRLDAARLRGFPPGGPRPLTGKAATSSRSGNGLRCFSGALCLHPERGGTGFAGLALPLEGQRLREANKRWGTAIRLCRAARVAPWGVAAGFRGGFYLRIRFAVHRGAADAQRAGGFHHVAARVVHRLADQGGFHVLERQAVAGAMQRGAFAAWLD